jgi:hypothetical protein
MANIIRDVVFRVQPKINFWFIGPLSQVLFEIAIKQATDLYLYAEIQDKVPRNPNQPIRLYIRTYMKLCILFCFWSPINRLFGLFFRSINKGIRHYFLRLFSTALNREKSHLACESIEAETRFVAQPLPTENIEE